MKFTPEHFSSHGQIAAEKNTTKTYADQAATVCGVKVVKKRQARRGMLAEAVKSGRPGGGVIQATVEFREKEPEGDLQNLRVEILMRYTEWTDFLIQNKLFI